MKETLNLQAQQIKEMINEISSLKQPFATN